MPHFYPCEISVKNYGLKIMFRGSPQQMQGMFEPWMIPDKENQPGVVDFKPREMVPNLENLWSWNSMALLHTVMFAQPPPSSRKNTKYV